METNLNEGEKWEGKTTASKPVSSNRGRIIFLFVIGFLLGVSIKAQAIKTITMGFDDYKVRGLKDDFRVVKEETNPANQQESETTAEPTQGQPAEETDQGTQQP